MRTLLLTERNWIIFGVICLIALIVTADTLINGSMLAPVNKHSDLFSLCRVCGYLPTWLLVAGVVWLLDKHKYRLTRAACIPLAAIGGGLVAEIGKITFRRLRPDQADGVLYAMRSFSERPLSSSGLAMPSSHAAVAFAAVFMLCRIYPRGSVIFISLGTGCAISRVLVGAHYFSDVLVAAMCGYAVAYFISRHKKVRPAIPSRKHPATGLPTPPALLPTH